MNQYTNNNYYCQNQRWHFACRKCNRKTRCLNLASNNNNDLDIDLWKQQKITKYCTKRWKQILSSENIKIRPATNSIVLVDTIEDIIQDCMQLVALNHRLLHSSLQHPCDDTFYCLWLTNSHGMLPYRCELYHHRIEFHCWCSVFQICMCWSHISVPYFELMFKWQFIHIIIVNFVTNTHHVISVCFQWLRGVSIRLHSLHVGINILCC